MALHFLIYLRQKWINFYDTLYFISRRNVSALSIHWNLKCKQWKYALNHTWDAVWLKKHCTTFCILFSDHTNRLVIYIHAKFRLSGIKFIKKYAVSLCKFWRKKMKVFIWQNNSINAMIISYDSTENIASYRQLFFFNSVEQIELKIAKFTIYFQKYIKMANLPSFSMNTSDAVER